MTWVSDLREQVEAAYDGLGLPSWPDPHAGLPTTAQEEYSRVTDPERYRIVHARAQVWVDSLAAVPGVQVERLAPAPLGDGTTRRFDRGVRIFPPRPDALPLLLLEEDAPVSGGAGSLAVLSIGVARPEIRLELVPDCGCDACDFGSDDLLEAIDGTIGNVVDGPLVVLRGDSWRAWWHPEGGASESTESTESTEDTDGADSRGRPDHRLLMESSRRIAAGESVRLPEGTEVLVGRSWFG
ncbi:DUF6226 family protein [Saccharomonospora azurea]|uniref:Uncharacterized protein n=1 Tax=Saccharomonospora azurea NA-128 TaxID=882081 RepID=H8G6Y5_9PSEU|nr:DUF6226 family protein [Saccharomonospora azurea]EHY87254.1 hypothetical protein SacazDRAFT_00272 [Saccharomonospora azurea NA-128]